MLLIFVVQDQLGGSDDDASIYVNDRFQKRLALHFFGGQLLK